MLIRVETPAVIAICVLGVLLLALYVQLSRANRRRRCARCSRLEVSNKQSSDTCPVCGAQLEPAATPSGVRSGYRAIALLGGMLALSGGAGLGIVNLIESRRDDADVESVSNARLLDAIREHASSGSREYFPPLHEIANRAAAGRLNDAEVSEIAKLCLDHQERFQRDCEWDPTEGSHWLDTLHNLLVRGKLGWSDEQRYLSQAVEFRIRARPRVCRGDRIPVEIGVHRRVGGGAAGVLFVGYTVNRRASGERIIKPRDELPPTVPPLPINPLWLADFLPSMHLEPGMHSIAYGINYSIYFASSPLTLGDMIAGAGPRPRPVYRGCVQLIENVEVLPESVDASVTLVRDEATRAKLLSSFTLTSVEMGPSTTPLPDEFKDARVLAVRMRVTGPVPCSVAFDVGVRTDDQEYVLGRIMRERGAASDQYQSQVTGLAHRRWRPKEVEVFLRPNIRVAEDSVGMVEMWDQELSLGKHPITKVAGLTYSPQIPMRTLDGLNTAVRDLLNQP